MSLSAEKDMLERSTILKIRCKEKLKRDFRRFAADYRNYSEALEALITNANSEIARKAVEYRPRRGLI